jgi:hypothetical protein
LAGISCPILPVDSEVFGPRFERRLIRSRIHSRMIEDVTQLSIPPQTAVLKSPKTLINLANPAERLS